MHTVTTRRPLLVVVLAAGKGTRMRSDLPKVLHAVAGRSMLGHVLATAGALGAARSAVVVGPGMEAVAEEARRWASDARVFVQSEQQGTANAVLAAREALTGHAGDVLVLYGDTPLIPAETLAAMIGALDAAPGVAVLGFEAADPTGYGRLLTDGDGTLIAIREDKDATPAERSVRLCNSGVLGFRVDDVAGLLSAIGNDNAKGEFYLTDAVAIARARGLATSVVVCPEEDVIGVNDRSQLAAVEAIWQARARRRAMLAGVTMTDPGSVHLAYDTVIGRDVVIESNVVFTPGVVVGDRVHIKANTYLEGADRKSQGGVVIEHGAEVGPFARLRPGTRLAADVHIGNFVEVKNAVMGAGAKANHLTYVGDASVGAGANIGAGTIFCNYDGFTKNRVEVGDGVFIGSNAALVAPVSIGAGAYVAAGSVITRNVAAGSLAITRASQEERPEWAAKYRAMMGRRKR
ncbi:MAG: bifunctional UDP-N-acetylglucosamine diphosphorylase/glucosamine-1-phosphate N-acetyltransferase GlmU [Hyphomicrobiaceae bacterium]|nr:bifunctional UDP-N-acetylglucosamine diphosphorylase/glucosamine-1-phosphate N-acetyltransferase GlmU [Hyphomicrobiaceae bacterium]